MTLIFCAIQRHLLIYLTQRDGVSILSPQLHNGGLPPGLSCLISIRPLRPAISVATADINEPRRYSHNDNSLRITTGYRSSTDDTSTYPGDQVYRHLIFAAVNRQLTVSINSKREQAKARIIPFPHKHIKIQLLLLNAPPHSKGRHQP